MKKVKSNKIKKAELQRKKAGNIPPVVPKRKLLPVLITTKTRNLSKAIEYIFLGKKPDHSNKVLDKIYEISQCVTDRDFLKRVLLHFVKEKVSFDFNLNIFCKLSSLSHFAIRKIEDWKAPSHNSLRCVYSFSRHLYSKYFIPAFMNKVWHTTWTDERRWFIHIGQGNNIRTAEGIPVSLTKKEAHYFLQAPNDFTPKQAFRYGQILNIGGNESFVRHILGTQIATSFTNNAFWMSVFTWFLQNPMLDHHHYGPIVDFIFNQRFTNAIVENGSWVPVQPNFSMKGRDANTLLKQVENWHKRLGKEKGSHKHWSPSGISSFRHNADKFLLTITEILSHNGLVAEGNAMHHCAGSYAQSCSIGRASIWSLKQDDKSRLTIEVDDKNRKITQARGKYNSFATASDKFYVQMWAKETALNVSYW